MLRYCLARHLALVFIFSITSSSFLVRQAAAADWRECEKAKNRQLDLQQKKRAASPARARKSAKSRSAAPGARSEEIEAWLWKNCREYSYELRTLEQQRM